MLGAALGIILALPLWFHLLRGEIRATPIVILFDLVFAVLFGVTFWVGLELWSGSPRALWWAKALLIAQIPSFTLPGFTYIFQTAGASVGCVFDDGPHLHMQLGSIITIYASPVIHGLAFGANIVAIAALLLLVRGFTATAKKLEAGTGLI